MNVKSFQLFYILCFLLLGATTAQAQYKQNLVKDLPFFREKAQEYNHWLAQKGLGKYLVVNQARMRPLRDGAGIDSTELELLLWLKTNDADTAIGMWNALKRSFDSPDDSLELALYRTFVHKMEIPGEQGSIHLYIKDKNGLRNQCFHIFIWQDPDPQWGKRIKYEYNFQGCRAKSFDIAVQPPPIKTTGKGKSNKVKKPKVKSANETFEAILQYMRDSVLNQPRYRTSELDDRRPYIVNDSLRSASAFSFTVADMGREVLTNQYRSSWEKFWGYNSIAMERLSFRFEYYPTEGGFLLKCTIDGKYGSGVFKPRASGYMNMEPDFDDFFETYKNKVRQELQKRL